MSAGEWAGLIAALAFVVLVGFLALLVLKVTSTLEEARRAIVRLTDETVPALQGTAEAVRQVNGSLGQVDGIAADAHEVTSNVSGLTSLLTTAVGGPLVKASAFSYGVRRALAHQRGAGGRAEADVTRVVRRELRAARRRERRGGAHAAGSAL